MHHASVFESKQELKFLPLIIYNKGLYCAQIRKPKYK
jgi:hypothetical protein